MTVVYALILGFTAGILSGMFGVGGGILFVPTLSLVVGLSHLSAEATSLAAIIPVVAVGAWQQNRYGNVRWRPALVIGLHLSGGRRGRGRARDLAQRRRPRKALRLPACWWSRRGLPGRRAASRY